MPDRKSVKVPFVGRFFAFMVLCMSPWCLYRQEIEEVKPGLACQLQHEGQLHRIGDVGELE